MLHIKFQASKPSGSEKEDFLIFFYVFLRFEPRIPWQGAILDPGTSFEQNWYRTTRQCFIPNFKHLSQVVLKKKIYKKISMYFYGSNLGLLARGHLGP